MDDWKLKGSKKSAASLPEQQDPDGIVQLLNLFKGVSKMLQDLQGFP